MKKIVLLVMAAFLFQSCIFLAAPIAKGQANKNLTVEHNAIPPDLGKDDSYVVCILENRESRDKYLKKYFKENYKGKYVFATLEEANSEKYADVNVYRYAFTYNKLHTTVHNVATNDKVASYSSSNYFIYDRKMDKEYNSTFSSGFFGKTIDAYTANMEKQRLANQ